MPFVGRLGTVEVLVPAGQNILIGSSGAGTTKVSTGTPNTAGNLPVSYTLNSSLTQATVSIAAASATMVKIEAGNGMVEYAVGATPQLTTVNNVNTAAGQHELVSTTNALTAHAGGGQGSAVLLPSDINRVTTVGTAADSVVLPPSVPGMNITVTNAAASNSMNVFPSAGGTGSETINALSANAAFAVAAGKTATFSCALAGQWHALLSA